MEEEQLCTIALSLIPSFSLADKHKLLETVPSVRSLFDRQFQASITSLNPVIKEQLSIGIWREKASSMLEHARQNGYELITLNDPEYPYRLRECPDSPFVLYRKGRLSLNESRIVSIVGTRRASPYGRDLTRALVRDLAAYDSDIVVVSGLAYGIDIIAHQAALEFGLRTSCVLAHGLQTVYPSSHLPVARKMIEQGGSAFSELAWGTPAEEYRFLQRNRLVAGMCDACVVVESGIKGGSMRTAKYSMDYNKDIFAYPGKTCDALSAGCNNLIYRNVACLIESGEQLLVKMGWMSEKKIQKTKRRRFVELEIHQQTLFDQMDASGTVSVQTLAQNCGWSIQQTLSVLMELELEGLIERRPGGQYRLFMD